MVKTNLPMLPTEATKIILKNLPSRRMRDVVEKRFGLKNGTKHTLEGIGKEYKITRERVRQIEADALKHLGKDENLNGVKTMLVSLHEHIKNHGEVMAENHLLNTVSDSRYHPHLTLLLGLGKEFNKINETDSHHSRWTVNKDLAGKVETVVANVVSALDKKGKCVSKTDLDNMLHGEVKSILGSSVPANVAEAYLTTSKVVGSNPYGEYGLVHWPTITPRGIRDKAYLALARENKAMHFLEIAKAINKAGWSKRKAHPQTVHNELIKDNRFVLVGRGLYGLKEWGYEPGVVRDVVVSVMKKAGRAMSKEEIIKGVMEKRFVKSPTILLNLQNKNLFRRNNDGTYTLV